MSDNDIKTICEKIGSLQEKILKSKFAETVTESEMLCLILAVRGLNDQKAEIAVLTTAVDNSTKEFLKLHDEYQDQNAEIEEFEAERKELQGRIVILLTENEGLQTEMQIYKQNRMTLFERIELVEKTRAEAIKEFAERLKKRERSNAVCCWCVHSDVYGHRAKECDEPYIDKNGKEQRACYGYAKFESYIDNLVAEMTEGK